jgi:putative CocE/NonD family hydrolase
MSGHWRIDSRLTKHDRPTRKRVPPGCAGRTALALWLLLSLTVRVPAQVRLQPDAGKFLIQIQGLDYGVDTFTADSDGGSESEITYGLAGTKSRLRISIKAGGGHLKAMETFADPGGRFLLTKEGAAAKLGTGEADQKKLSMKDVSVPKRLFPYCAIAPEQLRLILGAYDPPQGGTQSFDATYSNALGRAGLIEGKLTITSAGAKPMPVGSTTIPVVRYKLSVPTPDGRLDADLYADSTARILLFRIPSQKLLVVRDGYQDLDKTTTLADPTLSAPTFSVKIQQNLRVKMRDGITLAADIYRPDAPGRFPVILQRTCYGRQNAIEASFYAQRGYVFVTQDVRGKFDSEGEWQPWVNEARDGADTVEWCARQPWSTGNIGMIGASYLAFVQWAAAIEGNTHLKCLVPIGSPPDPLFHMPYANGPLSLYDAVWWSGIVEGKSVNAVEPIDDLDALRTLPVTDVDKALFEHHIGFLQEWMRHPNDHSYWERASFGDRLRDLPQIPALHVSGWFGDGIGTKRNYQAMVSSGHKNQKLIYGPWSRAVNSGTKIGDLDFGPQSVRDLETLYLRWFDHWLKDVKNGVEKEPPVDVFMMGVNVWRTFTSWPPKEARQTRWYLHSAGNADSDPGDGTLSMEPPGVSEPADHYVYDPIRPFIPRSILTGQELKQERVRLLTPAGAPNIVRYMSAALDADVTVAGPISLQLFAETSARDTDWFASLEDVDPYGKSLPLVQGIAQARFRASYSKPTLLKPGEVAGYTIDLWAIGHVFAKGHRIRVTLTSSCFPLYARNLNTGENNLTTTQTVSAHQAIYHTAARPSYIVLPTLRH